MEYGPLEVERRLTVTQSIQRQTSLPRQNLRRQLRDLDAIDVDLRCGNQHSRRLAVAVILKRLRDFRSSGVALELRPQECEKRLLLDLHPAVLSAMGVWSANSSFCA